MSNLKKRSTELRVVPGGYSEGPATSYKQFISAYITNTRLMGVVGVYVHWKLPENSLRTEMHQFFYLDAEEYGLDTYECIVGPEDEETWGEVVADSDRLMGGLGGQKVDISERELMALVQDYAEMNVKMGLGIPENPEFRSLLKPEIILTREEEKVLMGKQCELMTNDFQLVNYFIMRCVGRDFKAAKFLTKEYIRTDLFPEHKAATLLKNEIEIGASGFKPDKDGESFSSRQAYLCKSIIEYDDKYFVTTSEVTVEKLRVVKYERLSSDRISAEERDMQTMRAEYISVYDYEDEVEDFDKTSTALLHKSQISHHESGRLFLIFKPNNEHVSKKVFRLSDDVFGVYYLLDSGQLLIATYERTNLLRLELDIAAGRHGRQVSKISRYCFNEPVLYEFVNSGVEDFEEFVDIISDLDI